MVNFIVVDDVSFFRNQIKDIIIKFSFKANEKVNIFMFSDFNTEFRKATNSKFKNKFYILDIETKKHNGIEEVRKIRKNDTESPVIFSSMYERSYSGELLRSNLKFDFVSKMDDRGFEKVLFTEIMYLYNEVIYIPKLNFQSKNDLISIPYKNINYIEAKNGEINVRTKNGEIPIRTSLVKLKNNLPLYFFQCHRSCIVNLKNIIYIGKKIIFDDGDEVSKISKYKKKELKIQYKKEQDNNCY